MDATPDNVDSPMPDPLVHQFIRQQMLAARKAGERTETIEPISPSRLDSPITCDGLASEAQQNADVSIQGYRIEREISRGGQAVVLQAIQESTGRKMALKIMSGGAFPTSANRARFDREAAVLATMDHPGIVRIIDRGRTSDGSFFIAMDFVDGENLDVRLHRPATPLTQRQVIRLFVKIARALHEAHSRGIVHRDLKPSNIMIDRRDDVRILDFGLAHLTRAQDSDPRLTVTGNIIGSLPWASPEQAVGDVKNLGAASDVYSLGLILYQAITGQPAYPVTGTLPEITQSICHTIPAPAGAIPEAPFGRINRKLANILRKCLEKSPASRYATAGALADDLENFLAGRRTSVQPGPRWQRWIPATLLPAALIAGTVIRIVLAIPSRALIVPADLPHETNDLGMEFIRVPAGTFRMGSYNHEAGLRLDEVIHFVHITKPFWLSRTEVTRGQYRRIMGSLPPIAGAEDPRLPVDRVSWSDAVTFCQRLGATDGRLYRLPTEAEWEYACRAGNHLPFSGTGKLDDMGWHAGNSTGRLHPVSWKQPNQWGLHDMHGNVAEWCADGYLPNLGTQTASDPFTPPHQLSFVVRGGHALSESHDCRAARRENARD